MNGQEQSVELTRSVMGGYFESEHSDVGVMADDVVFTVMATGDEHRGPEAVQGMLDYFYRVAFTATAEPQVTVFDAEHATWEGSFVGRHTGDFMGIAPTGMDVRVPLCVVYDLRDGKITAGRVYFEVPALMAQLGAP
ncbi:ester cyclase [Ornithinimicrobium cerasi]|uniref:Predicted ester cyclase n=1 Tax=Ornithinimicrobium cerasi TaxID=2248773 RepID=A0A285VDW2_9MICO|nr:ester cyclase [Ornithinimicrobium cerasi]SOC52299.1 Predicted ester cyclase [Ornithinimicrobium cerasi]